MPHDCYWPECPKSVSNKTIMCPPHWANLPNVIKAEVWRTVESGTDQEYTVAVQAAQQWALDRRKPA